MASEHKRRGWRTWFWSILAVVALAVVYVLSYAPYLRFGYGSDPNHIAVGRSQYVHESLYGPIEWLIENTSAKEPMLWWAGIWGVNQIVADGEEYRDVVREIQRERELEGAAIP